MEYENNTEFSLPSNSDRFSILEILVRSHPHKSRDLTAISGLQLNIAMVIAIKSDLEGAFPNAIVVEELDPEVEELEDWEEKMSQLLRKMKQNKIIFVKFVKSNKYHVDLLN